MKKRAWSPADGPGPARQQIPPSAPRLYGDGSTERARGGLWAGSEGPLRCDPGGPGGEPDGKSMPPLAPTGLNEA